MAEPPKDPPDAKTGEFEVGRSEVGGPDVTRPDAVDPGPLEPVRGRCVHIRDLVGLTLRGGNPHFSEEVRDTLALAGSTTGLRAVEGMPVVDLEAYLGAAIRRGAATTAVTPRNAHAFLAGHLAESGHPPGTDSEAEPVAGGAAEDAIAGPDLTEALARAAEIVQRTHLRQKRVDARHVLAAILLTPPGWAALRRLGVLAGERSGDRLWSEFMDHLKSQPTGGESLSRWAALRQGTGTLAPPDTPAAPRFRPAFDADTAAGTDALGIAGDVQALAELVCLRELNPPLAVGLFGDWGSGKSFFMERLAERIRDIASAEGRDQELFVGQVVQIRFNAWHYADANLWASLTAEFFEQLRLGGYEKKAPHAFGLLVQQVVQRVGAVEAEASALENEAKSITNRISCYRVALQRQREQRRDVAKDLVAAQYVPLLDDFLNSNKSAIRNALDAAKLPAFDTLQNLREQAAALADLPQRLSVLGRALKRTPWWLILLLAAAVFLPIGLELVLRLLPGLAAGIGQATGLLAGSILALGTVATAVLRAVEKVSPLLTAGTRYWRAVEAREHELAAEIDRTEQELQALQAQRERVDIARPERTRFLDRYRPGAQGSPTALLHYFLHESTESRQFDEQVGLVSRVRRAFETLDDLIKKQREASEPPPADGLPQIDRIVLYIDDLDRCRAEQVVHVLEAVHLLLAFRLFVVVVGVDARWLAQSLRDHYRDQLDGEIGAAPGDYLEKIFQIPLWLQPLGFDAGGSYGRLVESLIAQDLPPPPSPPTSDEAGAGNAGTGASDGMPVLRPVEVTLLPRHEPPETAEATRRRIQLTPEEVALIKALGPIVGKSPRAVKRFVNLYRLIRAQRHGAELEAFLTASGDSPPAFPAVLLLLAAEVGFAPEQARRFRWIIGNQPVIAPLSDLRHPLRDAIADRWPEPVLTDIRAFWDAMPETQRPSVSGAIQAVSRAMQPDQIASVAAQLTVVGRFSFNRPGA